MPERRVATLADAQRQVYWRRGIGWLLIGLSIIFVLLFFVKLLYIDLSYSVFADAWGPKLRHSIDLLLKDWAVLDLLWRTISTLAACVYFTDNPRFGLGICHVACHDNDGSQRITAPVSLCARCADHGIRPRDATRSVETTGACGPGISPDNHVTTTFIGQAVLHQYPAAPESWYQTS